jgi:hypothetical protein
MNWRVTSSKWVLGLSMLVMTLVAINLKWNGEDWRTIVSSDGKGYYSYLPALFIYGDPNFGFFDEMEGDKYYNPNTYTDYRSLGNGKIISKYYIGSAVAQTPFFFVGHIIALNSSWDSDGYSKPYTIMLSVAALFYLFIGVLFLQRLLRTYHLKESTISWVTVAIIFGTNLFYYTVVEAVTSHIYSFAFISMLLYYYRQLTINYRHKYLLYVGALLGIIAIVRPINILIVFSFPFLAGSWSNFITSIRTVIRQRWTFPLAIIIACSIVGIQLLYYKVATETWFVYSYAEEGFNFSNPHFIDILFSYRKGLFLYTPMYLISFLGVVVLWKKKEHFSAIAWILFFSLITYIFSSWWMWYYGGSFSSRVYVEFLPLFSLLLGLALQHWNSHWKSWVLRFMIVALIVLCQIQTYQYRYGQIHYSDTTKEMYWNNFMRIDKLIR